MLSFSDSDSHIITMLTLIPFVTTEKKKTVLTHYIYTKKTSQVIFKCSHGYLYNPNLLTTSSIWDLTHIHTIQFNLIHTIQGIIKIGKILESIK